MQRKFITNLALLLLLNLLIKPFWIFGIDRTVQNIVDANAYGVYYALFNFSLLFNILLDLGITNYNAKNIAEHPERVTKNFSGLIIFKLLLAFVYLAVTFVTAGLFGYDSQRFHMLLFLSINQLLVSFIQYLRSNIAGLQLYTLDSSLSVVDKTIMIGFCSILLWTNVFNLEFRLIYFVYAQTLAYLITSLIVFIILLVKTGRINLKIDWSVSVSMLKQTFPYALLVVAMMFYYRMDVIMLDLLLEEGEHQASIYAQSYRLMDAFIQVPILFSGLLLPMFAYRIKRNKDVNNLLKLSFEFIFVMSVSLALLTFFYSQEIITVLYHSDVESASNVLQVLIIGFTAIAFTNIFGTLLTANGNLRALNKIAIGGVLFNLLLNMFLIPYGGAYGAACASVLTHILVVSVQISLVIKLFKIAPNWRYLLKLVAFIIVLLITTVFMGQENSLILKIFILAVVSVISSLVLKIINLKKLYQIVISTDVKT